MNSTYPFILVSLLGGVAAGSARHQPPPVTSRDEAAKRAMVRDVEANGLDATSERPPDFRGMPVDRFRAFDAKAGWRFPLYLGGKAIGAKYGVSGIPQSVIAAKDGSVIAKHVGFCSESEWKELLLKDIGAAIE